MEPTLHHGQYLMVNKLAYKLGEPQRGYIVVFRSPQEPRKALIKRVVGLPGDEITIVSGQVYINGEPLEEPYVVLGHGSSNWGPRVIGYDEFLVLGDNRNNSNDSRHFGPIHKSTIIGKAWFSLWPPQYGIALPHYNSIASENGGDAR